MTPRKIVQEAMRSLKPPRKMTISEWADEFRMLPAESSAEAGRWRTSRTEYMRGIMDAVLNPNIENVIIMSSSQVGKTELILNIIGYFVHYDPCPILVVQPTEAMAKTFSRDRLTPMIRDTKVLSDIFSMSKTRSSANTILQKSFLGGALSMIGANSPAQMASRPIRVLLMDEVDRYEVTKEGSAPELTKRRTATFSNRKIIMVSTPNISGSSAIEKGYLSGTQSVYEIQCYHCNKWFDMQWEYMVWEKKDGEHNPKTAAMECPHCHKKNEQKYKAKQVANGEWKETAKPDNNNIVSFKIGSWLSPYVTYADIVEDFLSSKKKGDSSLRVHVNTFHGEPWEENGRKINMEGLFTRRRKYTEEDHDSYHIITLGVDMQDNRAEFEVVGWNRKKQSWALGYEVVHGDPNFSTFWNDLDARLDKYKIDALAIDTGGHHTKQTYRWIYNNRGRRYYAIKGRGGEGIPHVNKPTKATAAKGRTIDLYTLGTDAIKKQVSEMLSIERPDANGYANFIDTLDKEFFLQMTAEREIEKRSLNGSIKKIWKKIRERNEAFDCRCYAYAAVEILQPNWHFIEETNNLNKNMEVVDNKDKNGDNEINYRKLVIAARRGKRIV